MILDALPQGFRPLVQVVDGFDRNHKLGLVFEARVGKGRLLVCSIDLPSLQAHPEARQLLASLQRYLAGAAGVPVPRVDPGVRSTARSSTAVAFSRWLLSSSASPTMPSSSADAAGLFSSISPSFATISWRPSSL